ncbi:MAG: PAS domain-containing protein [Planctomycetota bacterium]|nr:PAS domain-containing protein [Planctomycetota bacterium]MCX8039492.1 PAS domain-containing protein [Planctomycetota bacterium]MDW8373010.1 PAS domain-containing protein [Planctomycetota bacterium]
MSPIAERLRALPQLPWLVLDALEEHIAVIAVDGTIVLVNRAWREFMRENGGSPQCCDVGANYFAVCWQAVQVAGDPDARRAYDGLRSVLNGERVDFAFEYPCHSPQQRRWFLMHATALRHQQELIGAVVLHLNITRRRELEEDLETARRELTEALFRARTES